MEDKTTNNISTLISELSSDEVQFDPHFIKDELCPKLWNHRNELDPLVREKLLDIANRFYRYLGIEAPIVDILLTGSLSGYDWHQTSSDIDLHLVVNYKLIGSEEFVRSLMNSKKQSFNSMRKGVRIRGYEVECYCQDASEYHAPSGLYSIQDDRWVIQSQKVDPKINVEIVSKLISVIHKAICNLGAIEDNQERLEKAIELKNSIVSMRRISVRQRNEFSEPNLAYKTLRRAGIIDHLFDVIRNAVDRKLSLEQTTSSSNNLIQESTDMDEKKLRDLIRAELEPMLKKNFSTRPILSKVEIERIADSKVKLELKDNLSKDDVRMMVRKMMLSYHKWMWEKKGIWISQI